MRVFAGVDCGATNLRVGLSAENGQMLGSVKVASPLKNNPLQFASIIKQQITQLMTQVKCNPPLALGVGTPGPLDLQKGWILPSANLGNFAPIDLRSQLDAVLKIHIALDRDTNVALIGEAWRGAAVGKKDVVMLTLGSGVGGALLVNGEIDRGVGGKAGELGHMFLEVPEVVHGPAGRFLHPPPLAIPKCGLGHEGCFEALINSARSLEELSYYLGYGLANIVDIFNPEMIVIGGGKLFWGDFLPGAIKEMKKHTIDGVVDRVEVTYAKLRDLSGVYGAARLAMVRTI